MLGGQRQKDTCDPPRRKQNDAIYDEFGVIAIFGASLRDYRDDDMFRRNEI